MNKRLAAIAFVAFLLLWASWLYPQHGRPGVGGSTPSTGQPGVGAPVASGGSIYDSATAIWNFNDPADLGAEARGVPAYDLTLVNTPTATGGALGYSTYFLTANSERAEILDNASVSADGADFGHCYWYTGPVNGNMYQYGHGTDGYHMFTSNTGLVNYTVVDSLSGLSSPAIAGGISANTRHFICGWYTASDKKAHVSVDDANETLGGALTNGPRNSLSTFAVGAAVTSLHSTGSFGPMWYYKGSVPPTTALYNSGKGMTCADTTEVTNLESCWEMNEDGGPYADSIGSNTLTGVNTPTRTAGLVERSDSGMSVLTNKAATSELTSTSSALNQDATTGSLTLCAWLKTPLPGGGAIFPSVRVGQGQNAAMNLYSGGATPYLDARSFDGVAWRTTGGYNATFTRGEWNHFCMVTIWGTSVSVYENGVLHGTPNTDIGNNPGNHPDLFAVGRDSSGTLHDTNADDVAIWHKALTTAEMAAIYAAGAGLFYPEP